MNWTTVYGAWPNEELTEEDSANDVLRVVELCLGRNQPVRVCPSPEQQPLSDQSGPALFFFSPVGTGFHFGDDLVDRDGFATALYEGGGLFLSIDTDSKPFVAPIPVPQCSSGLSAAFVPVEGVEDFDTKRRAGEFGNAPELELPLDAARIHLAASCGEDAKCPGTLGPICK